MLGVVGRLVVSRSVVIPGRKWRGIAVRLVGARLGCKTGLQQRFTGPAIDSWHDMVMVARLPRLQEYYGRLVELDGQHLIFASTPSCLTL